MALYEAQTFETILNRMLAKVPGTEDKREGSPIYDALAPSAAEMALMYIELDVVLNETFADTASREYLIKRAADRGITPTAATKAVLKGEFKDSSGLPCNITLGSRFSLDSLNYSASEKISDGVYKMECETAGTAGNSNFGAIIPVEYIAGLASAQLTELLIPGENEEETEALRTRYFSSLNSPSFGGNQADYKEKTNSIAGVGGVKVYPAWNGGGTVKLVILDSEFKAPTQTLIDDVQTTIDPVVNAGLGMGLAPIGHTVTVEGATAITVDIATSITLQDGFAWEDIKSAAEAKISVYFSELSSTWQDNTNLIVRVSQIEVRLLDVTGIIDVQNTSINGLQQNLVLGENCIPKLGVITA